jgi:hypothetical protein
MREEGGGKQEAGGRRQDGKVEHLCFLEIMESPI